MVGPEIQEPIAAVTAVAVRAGLEVIHPAVHRAAPVLEAVLAVVEGEEAEEVVEVAEEVVEGQLFQPRIRQQTFLIQELP